MQQISLTFEDALITVPERMTALGLDFDDAYQYTVAERYNLTIVSFDRHFDATLAAERLPQTF